MRWPALAGIVALGAMALAGPSSARAETLALRGTGIRVDGQTFLLGERRQPSTAWRAVPRTDVEYMTGDDGRVIALRCSRSCSTDASVRIDAPEQTVLDTYGAPRSTGSMPSGAPFLLYAGLGFELHPRTRSVVRIYVLPNA